MTTNMSPPPPKNPTTTTDSSESMPPPPPKTPNTTTTTNSSESMPPPPPKAPSTTTTTLSESMPPPPPKNPNPPKPEEKEVKLIPPESTGDTNSNESSTSSSIVAASPSKETNDNNLESKQEQRSSTSSSNNNIAVPYTVPSWSGVPSHSYSLEVLKDGSIIDQFNTNEKGAYMFGRVDLCDFILEHPTISRFHAVLQFKSDGSAYLYDLGSTHGTFVNKNQVKKRVYIELHVGDVIKFGHSTRLYILQGPTDLMPPEADLERIRKAKMGMNNRDMEESLKRAKLEASRASGVSWGMQEDAIEENEDEVEEITWQTYKGQLTEKQEKTREKVIKRLEKITHMKKEIDAIRAKDISQGGLTQGQQTQIARNEQRISQILEELENLEETLNESIRESLGARSGRIIIHGKRKIPGEEEEEEYLSDEDEFYDRTQKVSKPKIGENQAIETADSLLDKRDEIILKIEEKKKLLLIKKDDVIEKNDVMVSGDDELDAYMSSLSSQLVLNEKELINKEISTLESELNKILYLLKVADPIGEASRKRDSKEINENISIIPIQKSLVGPAQEKEEKVAAIETEEKEEKAAEYTIVKPQWLGAVPEKKKEEIIVGPAEENEDENDGFVDYKDRSKISEKVQSIENAGPGLIIRKRKKVEKDEVSEVKEEEVNNEAEMKAEDAVALLLRHSRGYKVSEDDEIKDDVKTDKRKKKKKKQDSESTWVPPKGQSGDGRTSLNDRYGY